MVGLISIGVAAVVIVLSSLKVVNQYERGVKFTLGKYSGIMDPGLRIVIPIIQTWRRIDMRVKTVDVPSQECMSKENISVSVNAVLYYRVQDAKSAVLEIENYNFATAQLSQTTMRNIVGEFALDDLLQKRDEISKKIEQIVDKATDPWGIDVSRIEIKDIALPQDMKRTMAKEAEAEREKRAVIIKAEGEVIAANNMSKAAATLAKADGALHLRTLQSINDMSSDQSNTVVYAVPLEILRAIDRFGKK